MALTPLFLEMKDKKVLIIGTGSVGIRRARRFLEAGATVSIITHHIDDEIRKEFIEKGAQFFTDEDRDQLIDESDILIIATDDHQLNNKIAKKGEDKLVNCASNTEISNTIVPSTFKIGDVTVSLYTDSKSPLMAKQLRKKIQSIITPEDILNIKLQENIRETLKENIVSQTERKKIMTKVREDPQVQEYLKNGELEKATQHVQKYIIKDNPNLI